MLVRKNVLIATSVVALALMLAEVRMNPESASAQTREDLTSIATEQDDRVTDAIRQGQVPSTSDDVVGHGTHVASIAVAGD